MTSSELPSFIELANQRFESFLRKIPAEFYKRLADNLSWSEIVDGLEIMFSVSVLDQDDEHLHIGVTVTGMSRVINPMTNTLNIDISTSYIIPCGKTK